MRRLKLYSDTSVLGGLFDIENINRVNTAKSLISAVRNNNYEGFVSFLTIEEISKVPQEIMNQLKDVIKDAQLQVVAEGEDCLELANTYIKGGAIPLKYRNDARHIAICVYHDIDFIVSWKYKSLEWIHKIREEDYKKTKDLSCKELIEKTNHAAAAIVSDM